MSCLRGRRVNLSGVGGALAWITCQPGWHTKVSSIGDIGGNTRLVSSLFLKLFPKTRRKLILFKSEKEFRFQVIYTSNIFYFLEFSLDI